MKQLSIVPYWWLHSLTTVLTYKGLKQKINNIPKVALASIVLDCSLSQQAFLCITVGILINYYCYACYKIDYYSILGGQYNYGYGLRRLSLLFFDHTSKGYCNRKTTNMMTCYIMITMHCLGIRMEAAQSKDM